MGSRCVKKWLVRPLLKKEMIIQRQMAVELFIANIESRHKIRDILKQVGDLERVVGRIALNRASLHDYVVLSQSLFLLPEIQVLLQGALHLNLVKILLSYCRAFDALNKLLKAALNDDISTDFIIKNGFDKT